MKNALIVGGKHGVGKGIAAVLSEREYNVFIADIDITDPDDKSFFVDATAIESVKELGNKLVTIVSNFDLLVITIGAISGGPILSEPYLNLKWMLNVNLFGVVNIVNELIPLLKKSTGGKIVLTCSSAAFGKYDTGSGVGLYTVCKSALLGYFKVLREELTDIQVSLLIPSGIRGQLAENSAELRAKVLGDSFSEISGTQPADRILTDPYIAAVEFVDQLLAGRVFITNCAPALMGKISLEFDELKNLERLYHS